MPVDAIVQTPFGTLEGRRAGGVTRFGRVPYSAPRLGPDRFGLPTGPLPWPDLRDATGSGAVPPQLPSRLDGVMGVYDCLQDEDCLHLDIWRPDGAAGSAPVLVFIHGGAFMTGGGSMPCYDGGALARRTGMVVVTVSYRLGILGFMPVPEFGAVNLGLHDQVAALRWVRAAIGAFGGDAANVTVAGQSAGAFTIAAMLGTPVGRGLFDKAILMSAPLGLPLRTAAESTGFRAALLREMGHEPEDLEALRSAPVAGMLQALARLGRRQNPAPGQIAPPFMPVIDGDLIPRDPILSIRQGSAAWCPTLIGVTREEHGSFHVAGSSLDTLSEAGLLAVFAAEYGDQAPAKLAEARAGRVPATPRTLVCDLRSDLDFVRDSRDFAASQFRHGQRASYAYQFDWPSPMPGLGAGHCLDLPFLFGNPALWETMPMVRGADRAEVEGLSALMQGAFAAFARTGAPAGEGLAPWPAHGPSRAVLHFDRKTTAMGLID